MEQFECFCVSATFPYKAEHGPHVGEMLEKRITTSFTAENKLEAIDSSIEWANGRYEAVIKNDYKESFLGSIHIGTKHIGSINKDKTMNTFFKGYFFEWKYVYPGGLQSYIDSFESKFKTITAKTNGNHIIKTNGDRLKTMTKNDLKHLGRGDVVRNIFSSNSYIVDANYGMEATAFRTINITNPDEWILVHKCRYETREH